MRFRSGDSEPNINGRSRCVFVARSGGGAYLWLPEPDESTKSGKRPGILQFTVNGHEVGLTPPQISLPS